MHKPSYDTGYNDGCANSALGILIVLFNANIARGGGSICEVV